MNQHVATLVAVSLSSCALAQNCGPWLRIPTSNPSFDTNLLIDIATPRMDLAMAVGYWNGGGFFTQPIVQRWNGSTWNTTNLPPTSHLGAEPQVEGIGRVPGDDMWVVGHLATDPPTSNVPLVMRWRNNAWDSVSAPTLMPQTIFPFWPRGGFAQDIAGTAANNLWVVGTAAGFGDESLTSVAMALRWDGATWTDVPVPPVGNRSNSFDKVSASSSTNVWAIGVWRDLGNSFKSLIMRWNGTSWRRIENLGEGLGGGTTAAIVALAPNDVWVSGLFNNATIRLMHWNGSDWDIPQPTIPGVITSFAAIAPNDIWGCDNTNSKFYHYDGVSWTMATTPIIPGATQTLRGYGMDSAGPCRVWSVGRYNDGTFQRTLVEQLGGSSCDADFNNDGMLDFFDYLDFILAFSQGQANADFNGDLTIDLFDYLDFVQAFNNGC